MVKAARPLGISEAALVDRGWPHVTVEKRSGVNSGIGVAAGRKQQALAQVLIDESTARMCNGMVALLELKALVSPDASLVQIVQPSSGGAWRSSSSSLWSSLVTAAGCVAVCRRMMDHRTV